VQIIKFDVILCVKNKTVIPNEALVGGSKSWTPTFSLSFRA